MELLAKNKILPVVVILLIIELVSSFLSIKKQSDDWSVPEKYKKMKNPTVANKTDLKFGKSLYIKNCKSCHAVDGKGSFPNAGDFTSKKFQLQTDGALFYKIKYGRNSMPGYEKSIPENEDRWILINYLRTLE